MGYLEKLRNHEAFTHADITRFCFDQVDAMGLHDYVEKVSLGKTTFMAHYFYKAKEICIAKDIESAFEFIIRNNSGLFDFSYNSNDVYNAYVIDTIFHELWHANQRRILESEEPSYYQELIRLTHDYRNIDDEFYVENHSRFFHEYDAVINAAKLTLNYIKNFNYSSKTLAIINRIFTKEIVHGYGYRSDRGYAPEHHSPITFLKDTIKFFNRDDLKKYNELFNYYSHKGETNTDLENLMEGNTINDDLTIKIIQIAKGRTNTTNIFDYVNDQDNKTKPFQKK